MEESERLITHARELIVAAQALVAESRAAKRRAELVIEHARDLTRRCELAAAARLADRLYGRKSALIARRSSIAR